jgi:hypothetical protein
MIWTAWNNGRHHTSGAGYGFKVDAGDRDRVFSRSWATVEIRMPAIGGAVTAIVNIDKESFWGLACRELINQAVGQWLIARADAPWPRGTPPKFEVAHVGDAVFDIIRAAT